MSYDLEAWRVRHVDPLSRRPSMSRAAVVVLSSLVLAAAGGGFLWWRGQTRPPLVVAPPVAAPAPPAPVAPPPAAPTVLHPVPQAASAHPLSLENADARVKSALVDLLGHKAVRSFLKVDDVLRRFVATVDNLATDNATAQLWPVNPTGGRLDTQADDGAVVLSARNADRYAPFVHLVQGLDAQQAAALYVRLYPLLQRAYEELGYPGRYFNDRVVEVIDNLLATPAVAGPVKVKRFAVDGAAPTEGGLYLFEDPRLEACTAGQKIMLRMGRDNAQIVTAKLTDLRRILATAPALTATAK
jgi:hypothetical protein